MAVAVPPLDLGVCLPPPLLPEAREGALPFRRAPWPAFAWTTAPLGDVAGARMEVSTDLGPASTRCGTRADCAEACACPVFRGAGASAVPAAAAGFSWAPDWCLAPCALLLGGGEGLGTVCGGHHPLSSSGTRTSPLPDAPGGADDRGDLGLRGKLCRACSLLVRLAAP